MLCGCGGILMVITVHDKDNLLTNRLCDVECVKCGKIHYGQPYDFGRTLNVIDGNKVDKE